MTMPVKCTRAKWKRATAGALGLALAALSSGGVRANDQIVIAAPFSGDFAPIGERFRAIANEVGANAPLTFVDTKCDPEVAPDISLEILSASPAHVVGLPCIDVFDALLPVLTGSQIAVTPVGLQAKDVTSHDAVRVQRAAPTARQIANALAVFVADTWRDEPIAIIDDGTLSGRQFASTVQTQLTQLTITPIFRDTYRPLLENQSSLIRRLERAGATKVILGGDAFDAAIMAADANRLDVDLTFAGGQTLLATASDGTLANGTIVAAAVPLADLFELALKTALDQQPALTFDAQGEPEQDLTIIYRVTDGRAVPIGPTQAIQREG
ncbi:MAG: ABC transporter substrate-binding protein [Pseudomonadota bacterium]